MCSHFQIDTQKRSGGGKKECLLLLIQHGTHKVFQLLHKTIVENAKFGQQFDQQSSEKPFDHSMMDFTELTPGQGKKVANNLKCTAVLRVSSRVKDRLCLFSLVFWWICSYLLWLADVSFPASGVTEIRLNSNSHAS